MKLFRPYHFTSGSSRNTTAANLICGGDETVRSACGPKNGGLFSRARVTFLIIGALLISLNISAQENVQFHWPLTSTAEIALPSPYATLSFNAGRDVDSLRFTEDFGAMAGRWNSESLDPQAYYEYTLSPAPGMRIVVNQINLEVSVSRVNMRTSVQYSYDGFTRQKTQIGHTVYIATHEPRNLPVKTSLRVAYPQTLSIRIYGWSTVDYLVDFCTRNVSFDAVVFGRDLLVKSPTDTLNTQPRLPEIEPVTPETLAALPETEVSPELPQLDTAILEEALVAMSVLPEDILGGSERGGDRALVEETFNSSGTWTCPAGVTQVTVECWGGGGRGGARTSGYNVALAGGGGGAYSRSILVVTPGNTYTVNVGTGSTNTSAGDDSWFISPATILAKGGGSVADNSNTRGAEGLASQGVGDTRYNGGRGASGSGGNYGGGGGSSAGTNLAGNYMNNQTTRNGGLAPAGGGNGGAGATSSVAGAAGTEPGGGGGGGYRGGWFSSTQSPGNGANGRVIITYDDCEPPTIYNVTGGGSYCLGGDGLAVGLDGSENGVTYQLYRDGNPVGAAINGTGGAITFGNQTVAGTYTVVATRTAGGCTSNMNGSAVIAIDPLSVAPTAITGTTTICTGSSTTLTASGGTLGTGATVQWFTGSCGGTSAGTGNSITVNPTVATTYYVRYSGTCNTTTCASATVTVNEDNTVSPASYSPSLCINSALNPSITHTTTGATGIGAATGLPAGVTAAWAANTITISGTPTASGTFNYSIPLTGGCGPTIYATGTIIVNPLPVATITGSTPVCQGEAGQVYTTEAGMTNYNWSITGGTINSGNTTASVSVTWNTPGNQSISVYYTNGNGCTGNAVTFPVLVNPTPVAVSPGDQSFCNGIATPVINLTGTPSGVTFNVSGGTGIGLANQNGITALPSFVPSTGTATITITPVANGCTGSVVTFTITVYDLPTAVAPSDQMYCNGEMTTVISLSGTPTGVVFDISGGAAVGLANQTGVTQIPSFTATTGSATVTITPQANGCTGTAVTYDILVHPTPTVTSPGNLVYCHNVTTTPINLNGTPSGVVFDISGGTSIGLADQTGVTAIPSFTTIAGIATITITPRANGCTGTPGTFTITVQSVPTAGSIAADQYICFGGTPDPITSVQNGTGDGTITYRWERSVAPFTVWTTIAGITTAGYNPGPLAFTTQFRRFTVSTLNGVACESVASNIVTITIQDVAVTTGSIGNNQTICNGGIPENLISIVDGTATAGATVTYDWQINNTGAWVDIAGEHGPGLNISTAHTVTTSYRRRTVATLAGNSCVSSWTVAVTITVIQTVTPGSIAANQTICNGSTPAPLTSVTNGASPGATITYSWEQSTDAGGTWTPIGGATLATYAPGALTQTTWYRRITVATTNGHSCYSVPTNTVIITVQAIVNPGTIAASQTVCYNAIPAALTSATPATGSGTITYQWEYSINSGTTWLPVVGATLATYAPGALIQTTWYRRVATSTLNGNACSAASAHVVITVQGQLVAPVVTAAQPTTVCYNTAPGLLTRTNASGGSGTFTYQWQSSIDNVTFTDIGGATGATYQPPALTVTTYYRVMATNNPCGSIYSNVVTITVRPELAAPEICCDQIICTGYSAEPITTIVPPSGGSGSYSYQWMVSADDVTWNIIAGATLSVYTPPTNDRYYRLRITDNICGTVVFSNTVHVYTAFSLSAKFDVAVSPGGPYCPGSSLTVSIESGNITVSNKYIRYSWTADPNFINPATGGPVGNTDCFLWIFCWHWADIPYTVRNTTNATVTTNILITPTVYYNNGTVNCILPTEKVSVTIRPFMLQCPSDITVDNTPGSCSAQVPIPNIQWVPNSCTSTVNWTLSGATTGTGTGNMGTRTFNVGETTVTYSSMLNGQPTSCSFTVTVLDNQPPTLTCPANITRNTDAGQCTATINVPNPTISDNCGGVGGVTLLTWEMTGATLGNSPVTGVNYVGNRVFNAGVTTITYTAEDAAGNSSTCTFTVTVNDTQAPVFTYCPDDIPVDTDPGVCTATFDPPDPIVVDNCYDLLAVTWAMTGATAGNSPATGINFVGNTTFNPGVTIITYTASDPGGNTATCEFSVSVTDNEAPSFVFCPPGYNQGVDPGECFATIATTNPEPFDNCGIASLTWAMTGATIATSPGTGLNFIGTYSFNVGTTHVVYTLTDNSVPPQTATCTFDVTVTDNIPPTITCPGNQTRSTDLNVCTYTTQGSEFNPTVTDNCTTYTLSNNLTGGPTLAGYVFPIGTTTVQWVVIDAGGNSRQCSFVVTIEDNQAPAITTCAPAQTASANANCQAAVPDVTGMVVVTDNCTQTGYFTITQSPAAGTLVGVGITTITIRVEDENGNAVTCTTSFTVSDNTAPVFADCPTEPRDLGCNPVTLPNEAMAIANAGTVTDNCNANPTVTATGGSISSTGCDRTQTWTVTASDGTNTAQCVVVFEWTQDADLPVITTTAINNDDLGCNPTVTAPVFTGLDNCDGVFDPVVSTAGPTNTGCEYTQIWNANYTDACGNPATEVSITYTWTQDNAAPDITCPADQTVTVNSGNVYIHSGTGWDATATDNCSGTVTLEAQLSGVTTTGPHTTLNGVTFNQGLTTVTWTATDACGNEATCSFDVQVDGEADISVVKTVSPVGAITAGQNITYTLVVTNNGPAVAPEVTLLDNMPIQVIDPTTWTLNGIPQAGTWPEAYVFTNMAVGASGQQTIVITGKVSCNISNMFANTATVLLSPPFIDPNTGNNNSTVTNSIVDPVAVSGITTDGDCESNGEIDITATGGTPPYTYVWTTLDGVIPVGQENDEDLTGLVSGTYTVVVTDANGCEDTGSWTVTSEDTEPPTFTAPGPFDFCVINIISAQYDGAPEPAADIIPLLPEHGNPRRPDWYLVGNGSTELDLSALDDNCCEEEDIIISWTITFDPLVGGTLSGTGQPSLSTPMQLWGTAANVPVNHTITYTVTDCNGNVAATVSRNILIRPRPEVIKLY